MTLEIKMGDGTHYRTVGVEMEIGMQEFAEIEERHKKMTIEDFGKALAKQAGIDNGTVFLDHIGFRWVRRK